METALAALKPATTSMQQREQLIGHLMLAKVAHWAGDFADSKTFYDKSSSMAEQVRPPPGTGMADSSLMLMPDAAALAMSMGDYPLALRYLTDFAAIVSKFQEDQSRPASTTLMHCGALVGLQRAADAQVCLDAILKELDFGGQSPWEGYSFGPQALDPYDTARRIAAYHVRNGRYDKAKSILQLIKQRRNETLSSQRDKEKTPGRYWATMTSAAEIDEDEAAVHLAQGNDVAAALSLLATLKEYEARGGSPLKRVLGHLAAIRERSGNVEGARALAVRAAGIETDTEGSEFDPLHATLGLPHQQATR